MSTENETPKEDVKKNENTEAIQLLKAEVYDILKKMDLHKMAVQQLEQAKNEKVKEIQELENSGA